jgi:hypothetical protein
MELRKKATVIRLHPPVIVLYRICPGCRLLLSMAEVRSHRRNRPCPACGKFHLSDFIGIDGHGREIPRIKKENPDAES